MSPVPDFVVAIREKIGSEHPLWLPAVTAVVRRGDQVLLVKRSDNGRWTPVTGIVDPGEEPAVAAAREVTEETGVRVRVDRLVSTGAHPEVVHANGDRAAYLDLTFACTWLEGEAPRRRRRVHRRALVAPRRPAADVRGDARADRGGLQRRAGGALRRA